MKKYAIAYKPAQNTRNSSNNKKQNQFCQKLDLLSTRLKLSFCGGKNKEIYRFVYNIHTYIFKCLVNSVPEQLLEYTSHLR